MVYLQEMDAASIAFIEQHHYRIAAVIINPMQSFTGVNKLSPPGEKITFGKRVQVGENRQDYARWLHQVQERCQYCTKFLTPIAFVLDDVYFAFRTPELFSARYSTIHLPAHL